MDLNQIIRELANERDRIERIIESLEQMKESGGASLKTKSTRGRKSMDAAGRREVSERMKRYWASRRENSRGQRSENNASNGHGNYDSSGGETNSAPSQMAAAAGTGFIV